MSTTRARMNASIAATTLLLLLACASFRDLIPAGQGVGYDGARYARWTQVLSLETLSKISANPRLARAHMLPIDDYYARRLLLPVGLHYVLRAFDVERTKPNVIHAYTAANILLLVVAVFCWCRAADAIALGRAGKWIGFLGLVVSYANLKMPLFYPVLTDTFALALGSAALLFYLERRPIALALVSVAGAFAWPSFPYFALLLLAFPRTDPTEVAASPRWLPSLCGAAAAVGTFGMVVVLVRTHELQATPVEPLLALSWLSAAIAAVYVFFGVRSLVDSAALWETLDPRRFLRTPAFFAACAVFAGTNLAVRSLANAPTAPNVAGFGFVFDTFATSGTQPGIFALAHVLYFGPLLAFVPFVWKDMSRSIRMHGTGLALCFGLALLISVGSESRKLVNFYPAIALFLAQALERIARSPRRVLLLAAMSLLFSKIWLPMDQARFVPLIGDVGWRALYVSSRGPWIAHDWYLLQLVVVVALLAPLLWAWRLTPLESSH